MQGFALHTLIKKIKDHDNSGLLIADKKDHYRHHHHPGSTIYYWWHLMVNTKRFFMKTDPITQRKIIRDILISLVLFALPVLLMLLSFKISGQRPWKHPITITAR